MADEPRIAPREISVESWTEFRNLAEGTTFRSWAFRGQGDATWPLETSLGRYLHKFDIHRKAWVEQESRIMRIFRRKAHLFLEHVPQEEDTFEWLALMQHHGAPTRILDFTWSAYVAAFFALERAEGDAAVWAICPLDSGRPPSFLMATNVGRWTRWVFGTRGHSRSTTSPMPSAS